MKDMDNCQYIMQFSSEHPNSPSVSCIRLQSSLLPGSLAVMTEMLLASILTSLLCSQVCRASLRENRGLSCYWARAVAPHTLDRIHFSLRHKALGATGPGPRCLCTESGQTHPGHSLQTAFMTCVFAVFQSPRGELRALAAALPQSPESLGCPAC